MSKLPELYPLKWSECDDESCSVDSDGNIYFKDNRSFFLTKEFVAACDIAGDGLIDEYSQYIKDCLGIEGKQKTVEGMTYEIISEDIKTEETDEGLSSELEFIFKVKTPKADPELVEYAKEPKGADKSIGILLLIMVLIVQVRSF